MAKGKWAQGIKPRHFVWVIQDQLAICERPGGFGANHRKVRRQEEIIWIREQGLDLVVSVAPGPLNLHNYDELGVAWVHWPFPHHDLLPTFLDEHYGDLRSNIAAGRKLVIHGEEITERMIGFLAGYLVWTGMVPEPPRAIAMVEQITGRQVGPEGRIIVGESVRLVEQR
ncbi:MAG: hypothetical protein ACKOYM_07080 [Actinomycetes bacterium]